MAKPEMLVQDVFVIWDDEGNVDTFASEDDITRENMSGNQSRVLKLKLSLPRLDPVPVQVSIVIDEQVVTPQVVQLPAGK